MTNGTINKNTRLSVALVGMVAIPILGFATAFTTLKVKQTSINEKVDNIENKYVPRNEIELQLKSINEKLDILTKQNGK